VKLSDIMGYAQLSVYAEVALVIFLAVFVAIAIRLWLPSRQQDLHDASMLPLLDDPSSAAHPHKD
jgi:hypothetical protein